MSETLIPTMRLRFVYRQLSPTRNLKTGQELSPSRVLQQAFTAAETGKIVWRDVPLETEESL